MSLRLDLASILGCSPEEATALLGGRPVTPSAVEDVARTHYDWRRHVHDPDSYWLTITQASLVLGLRPRTIRRLLDTDRLPHITHVSGVRLMRRHEIEAIAERSPRTVPVPTTARS